MGKYDKEIEEYLKKNIPIMKDNLEKYKETNKEYEQQMEQVLEIEQFISDQEEQPKVK